ncbi:unnamed protein product [Parajaminaea phylloscopi]
MSLNRTLTTFLIDVSETMGGKRIVREETEEADGSITTKERHTTHLQWCLEFVSRKTTAIIFSKLKTAQMMLTTFGSFRTCNAVVDGHPDSEAYRGVDELTPMGQPTVATLDVINSLRAVREDEGGHNPDPLDAIVCAITAMADPSRGGVATTAKSWKRTIYLITDGMHPMDRGSIDSIKARLKEDRISLRVIGVDFDDPDIGFKEEDKNPTKAQNEKFWHQWLADIPDSRIASADNALEQARLPTVQLQNSSPYRTMLTFGDPDKAVNEDTVLSIPVKMFKLTTRVLPMSRKMISKLAQESEGARRQREAYKEEQSQYRSEDGQIIPTPTPKLQRINAADAGGVGTYEVETRRIHFLNEQVREHGTENAEALPEGAEEHFRKAYKLGATLVPFQVSLDTEWQSQKGLEIINWVKMQTFRRHYLLGEVWNVFADENNPSAQLRLSSLAQAMDVQGKLAIVRYVRQNNAEPKLGVLHPVVRKEAGSPAAYLHFAEVPFSEDLKRHTFPSLDRVLTADGKELKEHRTLPNKAMIQAMGNLVDSMDLASLWTDADGNANPWFSTEDSFNPAIHRMKEAVAWRTMHPESKAIPKCHWEVEKFLERPEEVTRSSAESAKACAKLFNIRYYPDKATSRANFKRQRDADNKAKGIRYNHELDLAEADMSGEEGGDAATKAQPLPKLELDSMTQGRIIDNDTDTDEEEMIGPAPSAPKQSRAPAAEPVTSTDDLEEPSNGQVVRILKDDPVGSLQLHLNNSKMDQGEVLRALQRCIVDLVEGGTEPSAEMAAQALRAGKEAASEYDEAEEWNSFMRAFKAKATASDPDASPERGQEDDESEEDSLAYLRRNLTVERASSFWRDHIEQENAMTLITSEEDEGGRSTVTALEARAFVGL